MTSTKIAELRQALNDNSQSVSGPTREDVENASQMSTADRMTMIEGMVSGLAEKLQSEPKNLAGWNRLIRSYSVLGKRDLAREAYQSAVAAFADDPTDKPPMHGSRSRHLCWVQDLPLNGDCAWVHQYATGDLTGRNLRPGPSRQPPARLT